MNTPAPGDHRFRPPTRHLVTAFVLSASVMGCAAHRASATGLAVSTDLSAPRTRRVAQNPFTTA